MKKMLIKNIGILATAEGRQARRGAEQGKIRLYKNAWILLEDDEIAEIGTGKYQYQNDFDGEVLDAEGRLVTPGLVDAHTHLVFGGWRQNELGLKMHGVSYLEILANGGGILSTVENTREASLEELMDKAEKALDEMLKFGTTTCEAKSGYGLNLEHELKQLKVVRELNRRHPIDLISTFLGAHAIPVDYKKEREEFIRQICEDMIPIIAEEKLAQFCDVFCETGVFTVEEARRILETGKKYGLIPKIHADEIEAIGGSQLAGNIGAISAEHLIVCPLEGIEQMAKGGTIACLLPATSFYLGANYAPAREMIQRGVPVAMATDFNPGSCPCLNLQLVINLGCLKYRMTPEEVLTAVTLNAAAAIGVADRIGTIEIGKKGDLILWEAPDLDYICYRLGSDLVRNVVKAGKKIR